MLGMVHLSYYQEMMTGRTNFYRTHHICNRMNPNHPLIRRGKIQRCRLEDTFDENNEVEQTDDESNNPRVRHYKFGRNINTNINDDQDDDDSKISKDSHYKFDRNFKIIMEKLKYDDFPSDPESGNYTSKCDIGSLTEYSAATKLKIADNATTMVHVLAREESPTKQIILESHSSHVCIDSAKINVPEHLQIKLPKPYYPLPVKEKKPAPRMDWKKYHRLGTIHDFMNDLEYDYPSICTTGTIGKSLEGRDIKILKISNTNTSNASVWIDAGIHAREWIAPAVATYIANHIATNFNQLPNSVTNKDWYFLPVVNPDGYEYTHTVDRMWRKNRAWYGGQCVGVDLNRNFSCGWGGLGSSDNPHNAFYRGPEAFSEPESTAMRDMLLNSGLTFKVYITLHSYGEVIIFPFAFKDELCPDYVRLLEGATVMSKAIYETSGNTYKVGISRDVMYRASGTSNDFSYGQVGIPYCYLIELRSRKHRFKLPQEEIQETGNEILNCVKALMEFIDTRPAKVIP